MVNFKDLLSEIRMAVSADYKVTPSGRKVHKMKKIADNPEDLDKDGDVDADDKKLAKEGVVPAHMQGKQKPYVSSDGKGNFEVLGNRGQTKATFHRKEHGSNAQKMAQAHLKAKYDEYMKENTTLEEGGQSVGTPIKEEKHRVQVTISDPNHTMATKRKEQIQKHIRVSADDHKQAVDKATAHYKKQGYKVHGAEHVGMVKEEVEQIDETRSVADRLAVAKQMYDQKMKSAKSPAERAQAKDDYDHVVKRLKEQVELDEVLDMRHHTTGTGSIHVSHTLTSPSRVHSIGYTDAHKISNLKAGEKHEYKNANGHETFTAHKQSDGSTKIHDSRGTHVTTIKNKMGRYDGPVKESLDEAADKREQRFLMLARLGLVDKADVSKLRIALDQLKADKPLTVAQRSMLLGVMSDLISLVTGDDAVFNRVKMDVQKEGVISEGENKQMKGKDPCWKGYQMVGMKDKDGKKVPNCVPTEEKEVEEGYVSDAQRKAVWAARNDAKEKKEETVPFDKPYTKVKGDVVDKSGAKHTPMSAAKHLARLALKRQQQKAKE